MDVCLYILMCNKYLPVYITSILGYLFIIYIFISNSLCLVETNFY